MNCPSARDRHSMGAPQNLWTLADFREKFNENACSEFGAFISNVCVVCDAALAIGKRALAHHPEPRRRGAADAMDDSRLRRWPDSLFRDEGCAIRSSLTGVGHQNWITPDGPVEVGCIACLFAVQQQCCLRR